jgi:LacI family transcriptional regulator
MATMKEIARDANVSTATVSHVINGTKKLTAETTERVLVAIQRLNYKPNTLAKSLRSGQTRVIGVLAEDFRCFPIPDLVGGIAEALEPTGFQMLMYDLHLYERLLNQYEQIGAYRERVNQGVSMLMNAQVDGVIYAAMHDRHLDGITDPVDRPLVYAYSLGTLQDYFVTYANKESAADLVRLLILRGHRKVAVLSGHPHSFPAMKRLSGYQIAMQEAGLPVPEGYIRYGDWTYESGYEKARELLSLPEPPTAIFAMNDYMAAGCLHALADSGLKVPEDISVVGFDNRETARFLRPQLTTVALPTKEIGRRAALMMLEAIENKISVPRSEILPCQIIERDSVREPRAKR